MSTRFLVPSNVGPAGPPGPEGPEGPPGDAKALIDDVTISTSKTYSSFKISSAYQTLLTTASNLSINQLSTAALSSLGASITVAKDLAAGTNAISADSVSTNTLTSTGTSVAVSKALALGTNTIASGAVTCTALSTTNGNVVAGTGTVSAATMTTNTLTSTGTSVAVSKALALGANTITCGAVTATSLNTSNGNIVAGTGTISCGAMTSTSLNTSNGNVVMGTGDLSCDAITSGQVTSTAGNVKLSDGSITDQAHIGFRATARPAANSRSYGLLRYNSNASVNPTAENKPFKLFYDQNNNVYGSTDPGTIQNQLEQAAGAPLIIGDLTCGAITGGGPLTGVTANASIINAGAFADARIPSLDAAKIATGTFAVARIPALPISQITNLANAVNYIGSAATVSITAGVADQWITPLTFVKSVCGNVGMGIIQVSIHETTGGNSNRAWGAMYQFAYRRSDFSSDSSSPTLQQIGTALNLSAPSGFTVGAITFEDDKVNSTPPYQVRLKLASITTTSGATGLDVLCKIYGNVL